MASNRSFPKYQSDGTRLGNLLEWFDARFPLTSLWKAHLSEYYAPKNLNFWYLFGSMALVVLVIQFVTGIFLVMHYQPNADLTPSGLPIAFESVEYIMREVPGGWFIRYMHSTGASFFFIIVYLHMFRGMLYGSYRKPRELIWVLGVLIFLCMMGVAFMGYLLPWGQMSYWGAQVILSFFSAIPVVGEDISTLIRGDYVVAGATLNRFFALHVCAVPLALLGLVVAHILALHEVGSGNPDGVEIKDFKDENGNPLDGVPFHPYHTVGHDLPANVIMFIFFFAVVFYWPEGGGYFLEHNNFLPANPMQTPAHLAPVWYFTAFYSMLRAMVWNFFWIDAKVWGVISMFAGVIILAFLPWLDRSPAKSIRYRGPIFKVLLSLFAVSFVMLCYLGTQSVSYHFFGYVPTEDSNPLSFLISGSFHTKFWTFYYFLFFLTMPFWSKIDKCKPVPERVTSK